MNLHLLELTDYQLQTCQTWKAPDGTEYLELAHTLVFPKLLVHATTYPDERQATPADYPFVLVAVSVVFPSAAGPVCYGRFQWPSGRWFSNVLEDLVHFYGAGQFGRLVEPEEVMPPGSQIRMQLQNAGAVTDRVINIHFEGYLRIPVVRGADGKLCCR